MADTRVLGSRAGKRASSSLVPPTRFTFAKFTFRIMRKEAVK